MMPNPAQAMAAAGRKGDTELAHVGVGEILIPKEVIDNDPGVLSAIIKAFQKAGADWRQYQVDEAQEPTNPQTGVQEFHFNLRGLPPPQLDPVGLRPWDPVENLRPAPPMFGLPPPTTGVPRESIRPVLPSLPSPRAGPPVETIRPIGQPVNIGGRNLFMQTGVPGNSINPTTGLQEFFLQADLAPDSRQSYESGGRTVEGGDYSSNPSNTRDSYEAPVQESLFNDPFNQGDTGQGGVAPTFADPVGPSPVPIDPFDEPGIPAPITNPNFRGEAYPDTKFGGFVNEYAGKAGRFLSLLNPVFGAVAGASKLGERFGGEPVEGPPPPVFGKDGLGYQEKSEDEGPFQQVRQKQLADVVRGFQRPDLLNQPGGLNLSESMTPEQMRAAIATRGVEGNDARFRSQEAIQFFLNSIRRRAIDAQGNVQEMQLLPIERQYLRQVVGLKGDYPNTQGLLEAIAGV